MYSFFFKFICCILAVKFYDADYVYDNTVSTTQLYVCVVQYNRNILTTWRCVNLGIKQEHLPYILTASPFLSPPPMFSDPQTKESLVSFV